MITKEQFTKLISSHIKQLEKINEIEHVIQGDIMNWNVIEYGNILFDTVLSLLFKDEAVDDIFWWLFEKRGDSNLKMWNENENEIPTETIDDLWEIVKDFQK